MSEPPRPGDDWSDGSGGGSPHRRPGAARHLHPRPPAGPRSSARREVKSKIGGAKYALDQAKRQLPGVGFVSREKALELRRDLAYLELAAPAGFACPVPRFAALLLQSLLRGESDVASGTVKWFNGQKGYGFIAPDGGGKDVFVHISAVEKAGLDGLPDGAKVTFDIVPNRGKESAENLRVK